MSASFLSGLNLTSILPPDSQWIAPWVTQVLQSVEGEIAQGHSPYPAFEETVLRIFYPSVTPGFRAMLWFLAGLFSLSIIIVLASLILRLQQGRFWLFHRVDKTIVIPNISTIYGICALAYAALGILSIVTAVRISKGERFPRYYLGLQAGWIAPLWVGFFCEAWATISAWYIRKKGAFYRESRWKTVVALTLPFLLPICAFVPVVVVMFIAARSFNDGYRDAMSIVAQLKVYDQSWTPAKGLDIGNLLNFFTLGEKFGVEMREYSKYVRIGYLYIAFTLLVTFAVYTTGASLEIRHLSATIKKLRAQSKMPRLRPRSPLTHFRRGTTSKSAQLPETKPEKAPVDPLDDEFFAGVKRQWTLLAWARNNRFYSACAIGLMLLVNAGIAFWLGVSPLSLMTNSAQFQVQLLVACWLNGILSTVVALLILFRSLDGSSPTVQRLRRYLPFLPFPPAISITDPSRATSLNTKQSRADGGAASHIDSRMDEPPKYPGSSWSNAHTPVMEERKGGTAFLEVPQHHAAVDLGLPETEYLDDEYDLDAALDNAWYGFGVSHVAGGDPREVDNLHVVLEMLERPASSMGEGTSSAVHTELGGGEGTSIRARTDSWDGSLRSQRSHERFDS